MFWSQISVCSSYSYRWFSRYGWGQSAASYIFALLSSSFHSQFLLSQQLTDLTFTVFFLYPLFLAHCNSAVLTASTDGSARHSDRGCHPCPFCQIFFLLFNPYFRLPNPHHSVPLIPPCLFPIPSRHLARLFTLSFFLQFSLSSHEPWNLSLGFVRCSNGFLYSLAAE